MKTSNLVSEEVKRYIENSVLCWLATSNAQNGPNVSPKEMFALSEDSTLLIANIAFPNSIRNIRINAKVCVSILDVFVQKGFKVKGIAKIIAPSYFLFHETTEESQIKNTMKTYKVKSIDEEV